MADGNRERSGPNPNAGGAPDGNLGPDTPLGSRDRPIEIDDNTPAQRDRPQEFSGDQRHRSSVDAERRNVPASGRNPGIQITRPGRQPQPLASNSNTQFRPERTSGRSSSASEPSSRSPVSTDGSLYSPSPPPSASRPRKRKANSIDRTFVASDSEESVDPRASYRDPGAESDGKDNEESSGDSSGESSGDDMESVDEYSTDSMDEEMADATDSSTYKDTGKSSSEEDSTDEADRGQVWVSREKR